MLVIVAVLYAVSVGLLGMVGAAVVEPSHAND